MECNRAAALLPRLADGALGPWARLRLTRHLGGCVDCAARLEELNAMRAAIRSKLPYHRAPPRLAARIGSALPRDEVPLAPRSWLPRAPYSLMGTGFAGALAGVVLTLVVTGTSTNGGANFTQAVVDSHIRSMMADHLTDVRTSDQHTVKPWLSARLDLSPPVNDLAAQGFPLVGGRLDYVDGRPAAAVVYQRAKHVINLFAWAASGKPDEALRATTQQGFHVVAWRRDGVSYCAVSDVEADQLMMFAQLMAVGR